MTENPCDYPVGDCTFAFLIGQLKAENGALHERITALEAELAKKKGRGDGKTNPLFEAYVESIYRRYGVKPDNSAKLRGQMAQLLKLLPAEEAPNLIRFFVEHQDAFYTKNNHDFGLLLRDAHRLRIEFQTGKTVTTKQAQAGESFGATRSAVRSYYEKKHGPKPGP